MRKTTVKIISVVLTAAFVCSLIVWLVFRNPYDSKYFTATVCRKYTSVEAVLDAFQAGWQGESQAQIALLNEVYGWDRFTQPLTKEGTMPQVRRVSYYRSKRLAVADFTDGSACWFVYKSGRWVFYPETIWLPLLETFHGVTIEEPEQTDSADS